MNLPDRRDKFEEVNSIRLVLQQQFLEEPVSCPLLAKDYTNKIKVKENLVFDPGGSTGRLHACPFLGTWRALLNGELLVLERLEEAGVVFG